MIDNVHEFHRKFGLPLGTDDQLSGDDHAVKFRVGFLEEELTELQEALETDDRVAAFDALLDLAYVAYGTALWLGIDPTQWHAGMRAVHNCNMAKERALNESDSKRGSTFDVVKPDGWVGPEAQLKEILSWPK